MEVKIRRIDDSLPLPKYYSDGAVAFDVYARTDTVVLPHSVARIPTNLVIEVPKGYLLYLKDRSSTATRGLFATAGIVDQDFCGPEDEILFQVYNYTGEKVKVDRGERIAQGILIKIAVAQWLEVENLRPTTRGGFGSSGKTI